MMKIISLLLSLIAIVSCNQNKDCNCEEKTIYIESPCNEVDSLLNTYTQEFKIIEYEYSDSTRSQINKWKNSLPKHIKDSLLNKKLIIQKTYFLSDIILNNEKKVLAIQKYNQKIETHLSLKIGLYQGIPTVLFSTSIENINISSSKKDEYFTVQINKLMY